MKASLYLITALMLVLSPCPARAQSSSSNAAATDGKIIEQTLYELPTHEQIPDRFKRVYSKEVVEKIRTSTELELLKIKYMSGGLKVVGFIYKPKNTEGKKFPVVIWNRGGAGEDTKISTANYNDFYEMYRFASEGFVVLASQYRGTDGGEGRDEAGGADTDDVVNLIPLAKSLGYVDMDRIFMWGFSRGALMALQAIRRGAPIRAAAVVGAPTDLEQGLKENSGLLQFAKATWPDFEARRAEHIRERSAVLWADELDTPLLLLHGGADAAVSRRQIMELAQKLDDAGKLYELIIYAGDDHGVNTNAEDRIRRTIDWFKNPRLMSIAQPLARTLQEQGIAAAVRQYNDLKKNHPLQYDWSERELNLFGYNLLATGRVKEAVEIFKLNVSAYPQSFNTYDSLGEALLADGQRELAIQNYRKSLELNPQNTNATDVLKKIAQP
jgi:dienelactone hydrolase